MGVRINSYKKQVDCMVGQKDNLGLYEVLLDEIEEFKTRKESITFWSDDIYLICQLKRNRNVSEFGINKNDFFFYYSAPNYYTSKGIRSEEGKSIGLMFDPIVLLHPITKLLDNKDQIIASFDPFVKEIIERNEEVAKLEELKLMLDEAVKNDLIIGLIIG